MSEEKKRIGLDLDMLVTKIGGGEFTEQEYDHFVKGLRNFIDSQDLVVAAGRVYTVLSAPDIDLESWGGKLCP